jgi:hypothetical protein
VDVLNNTTLDTGNPPLLLSDLHDDYISAPTYLKPAREAQKLEPRLVIRGSPPIIITYSTMPKEGEPLGRGTLEMLMRVNS